MHTPRGSETPSESGVSRRSFLAATAAGVATLANGSLHAQEQKGNREKLVHKQWTVAEPPIELPEAVRDTAFHAEITDDGVVLLNRGMIVGPALPRGGTIRAKIECSGPEGQYADGVTFGLRTSGKLRTQRSWEMEKGIAVTQQFYHGPNSSTKGTIESRPDGHHFVNEEAPFELNRVYDLEIVDRGGTVMVYIDGKLWGQADVGERDPENVLPIIYNREVVGPYNPNDPDTHRVTKIYDLEVIPNEAPTPASALPHMPVGRCRWLRRGRVRECLRGGRR